ncbi:TRAP transporter permease [Oceanobacillus senegalensis]|uniref:TRAP transporter permease n=1 Tax=Oceanobacillus senegalensis TaxID=1936063 RepID=UPI00117F131C|nr:TRAP transporter permease [Oceanobacillus senegalensis]
MKIFKRKPENEDLAAVSEEEGGSLQVNYIGVFAKVVLALCVIWTFFQVYISGFGAMDAIKFRAWHLGFLLLLTFLLYPATKKSSGNRVRPTVWDILCILITVISLGYLIFTYDAFIRERSGINTTLDYWIGGLAILMLFEASRRVVGKGLTIIAAIFLLYNFFGVYIPGILGHYGFSLERVINVMYWGGQGIFGIALGVSATYIFVFVLFGAFLKNSGFTDFINDLALTIAGRSAGGPAKVAIFGSGFMGMMSGSAVGNVVTTGAVTIPLMKKTGFKRKFAGAVEAVASTGGLMAPPVMGAAGFIMAQFLGVPYTVVAIAAIIPALLYYTTLFMVVHFEAKNMGLSGISKENIPNALEVFKERGHLIIPLIVLIGALFSGVTPLFAAIWALASTVIASWFRSATRMNLKKILLSIEEGAKGAVNVGIACAIVGIVIGTISLTSIGLVIGNNVISIAGDSVFLAALLTMGISIVLGMGIPVTAAYIIVAAIGVPILITMGVSPLSAHMFAFYYAALSSITPPVALASYAAAGIAGTDSMKVSIESLKIGITGFIIPFFFLYNPVLLFDGGTVWEGILAGISAIIGGVILASAVKGRILAKVNVLQRLFLFVAAFLMIKPGLIDDLVGVVIILTLIAIQRNQMKREYSSEETEVV